MKGKKAAFSLKAAIIIILSILLLFFLIKIATDAVNRGLT